MKAPTDATSPKEKALLFNELGNARYMEGDVDGAIEFYVSAIQSDPDEANPWFNLALAMARKEMFGEALYCFKRSILLGLADALRLKQAMDLITRLSEIGVKPRVPEFVFEKVLDTLREKKNTIKGLIDAISALVQASELSQQLLKKKTAEATKQTELELEELEKIHLEELERFIGHPILCEIKKNHVVSLSIANQNIESVPDLLMGFKKLEFLDLSYNKIKNLPDAIGNLESLRELDLTGNEFSEVPEYVTNLKKLGFLNLSFNKIKNLPDAIGNLQSLQDLCLDSNLLSELPETIGNLISLHKLSINNNLITNLPDSVGNLIQLEELRVNNNLLNVLPESFRNLPALRVLDLNFNKFNRFPSPISDFPSPLQLKLTGNQISSIPIEIQKRFQIDIISPRQTCQTLQTMTPSERGKKHSYIYKILVAGEAGVGKTTLLYKYVNGTFIADTSMTIGIQFHVKNIEMNNVAFCLNLWDFGGPDRYRFMLPSYTLGAKGALLFYDTTRMSTLDSLEEWVGICRTQDKNLPILFCGTKIDLVGERSVAGDYAKGFLQPLGLFDYLEVSAKTGENVEKVFETIVKKITERQEKEQPK